jgi:hypothetical protein
MSPSSLKYLLNKIEISYVKLRGCCFDIIVLNVHASKENKIIICKAAYKRNYKLYLTQSLSSI